MTIEERKWVGDWLLGAKLGSGGQGEVYSARRIAVVDYKELAELLREEIAFAAGAVRSGEPPAYPPVLDVVYSAFRLFEHAPVGAIKLLRGPEYAKNPVSACRRLEAEISALRDISHPSLIKMLDSKVSEGWFVMEYHRRGTLTGYRQGYVGNLFAALESLRPIVEGLATLHERNVVHRDIKPDNIFVADDEHLVLGDFGLVALRLDEGSRITGTYENVGTRQYMPPWAQDRRLDEVPPNFDTFSLGKVLWWLLSGRSPFPNHYFSKNEYDLRKIHPAIPEMARANDLLSKCIVDDEEKGVRDAGELLAEFDRILGHTPKTRNPALSSETLPHDLKGLAAKVKLLLSEDRYRIELRDLVNVEVASLISRADQASQPTDSGYSAEELNQRVLAYEEACMKVATIFAIGSFFGSEQQDLLWVDLLERIGRRGTEGSGLVVWLKLRKYPVLILLYSAGIAAVAARRFGTLKAISEVQISDDHGRDAAAKKVFPLAIIDRDLARSLPGLENHRTPISDRLFEVLREPLRHVQPDDMDYEASFDRYEYLYSLIHVHLCDGDRFGNVMGRFEWRDDVLTDIKQEAVQAGSNWGPLRAGLFDGSIERFAEVQKRFENRWAGFD